MEALHVAHARGAQGFDFFRGFDAFDHQLDAGVAAEGDHGGDDAARRVEARNQPEQRRLAAAGRTDDRENLTANTLVGLAASLLGKKIY